MVVLRVAVSQQKREAIGSLPIGPPSAAPPHIYPRREGVRQFH